MALYDYRDRSVHASNLNPQYCANEHILSWWTKAHDELLSAEISARQWIWASDIYEKIIAITPPSSITAWKEEDPVCKKYAWYNVLTNFAISRAESLNLTESMRKPEWRKCPLCRKAFVEDSLSITLIEKLGFEQIDFCAPCLRDTILFGGRENATKAQIQSYMRALAKALKCIPSQDIGAGSIDLRQMSTAERLAVLRALKQKPTLNCVKQLYGSWFNALIDAGVLENGTRRTTRGTQCVAKDGHMWRVAHPNPF